MESATDSWPLANAPLDGGIDLQCLQQQLLSYAHDLSATLKHLRKAHETLNEVCLATLSALAAVTEARDPYLAGHSRSVAMYAQAVGLEMGLPSTQMESLQHASLLHDIGKIGVPDSVLRKPGPLDEVERKLIREHPEEGYRILSSLRFLGDALMGVLHHHERYDGRGYPRGLTGEDIPMLARILCTCDALDAMTSNRSYRRAMSLERATAGLIEGRGTQFDPQVVDALVCALERFPFIESPIAPIRATSPLYDTTIAVCEGLFSAQPHVRELQP